MNKFSYPAAGQVKYVGKVADMMRFTLDHQLLNAGTWKNFVRVYRADSDDADLGWRCEYWGKMMRGACLTYQATGDEELYAVLDAAVRDLLSAQREDGRFSTYSKEMQFHGWDMWGRKYVLTGMLHFYRICRDDGLKEEILAAMKRHVYAIIEYVGPGKLNINETSSHWYGVNSSSILDAILDLYVTTGKTERAFLDFASYIISEGGCSQGNLIELALEDKVMPFDYPENKAYETISFFEGVLTYYEVTGEEKYLRAVRNFIERVNETDITVIGCSGCTHELFDHSVVRQPIESDIVMQETCVTVTWMRMLAKLHLMTGEAKYMERIELSAWNALYGATNDRDEKQIEVSGEDMKTVLGLIDPLPFDSYSPLYNQKRGRGVGGLKRFAFGGLYGCCACIASAGTGLFPLVSLLTSPDGFVINEPLAGTFTVATPAGQTATLSATSDYPRNVNYSLHISLEKPEKLAVRVRVPAFVGSPVVAVNGVSVGEAKDGYVSICREFKDGDEITFAGSLTLAKCGIGGRTAFTYGPVVLARDSAKEGRVVDLSEEITLTGAFSVAEPEGGEMVRLLLDRADGGKLLLTDYASCGKRWMDDNSYLTVFLNIR